MKNYDRSGMTLVEVLVSVIIISLVMTVLFSLLIQVQNANSTATEKSSLLISQAVITKAIEEDMIELGVNTVSACTFDQFHFDTTLIEPGTDYKCIMIKYNTTYDINDIGYIAIYKQAKSEYKDPSWVLRYSRGYYNNCAEGSVPDKSNWVDSYTVVQKLDTDNDISFGDSKVNYSANFTKGLKYSSQKTNSGNLVIPIIIGDYSYDLDLSFSFRLYYSSGDLVEITSKDTNFFCATNDSKSNKLVCNCSQTSNDYCEYTVPSEEAGNVDSSNEYQYKCSKTNVLDSTALGFKNGFLTKNSTVKSSGIAAENIKEIYFSNVLNPDFTSLGISGISDAIDISHSQNKSTNLYYVKDTTDGMYTLYICQAGGVTVFGNSLVGLFSDMENLTKVDFNWGDGNTSAPSLLTSNVTNMNNLFAGCKKLVWSNVTGFESLNFDKVKYMDSIFEGCKNITSSPLNGLTFYKLESATSMFASSGLTSFSYGTDLVAPNIKNMSSLLANCDSLTSFELKNITGTLNSLTDMSSICAGCTSLANISINSVELSALEDLSSAFSDCGTRSATTSIDINGFKTPLLTSASKMFYNAKAISKFSIVSWEEPSLKDMSSMFESFSLNGDTISLEGLSSLANVTNMSRMFYNCVGSKLKTVKMSYNWTLVEDASYMFAHTSFEGFILFNEDGGADRSVQSERTAPLAPAMLNVSGMFSNTDSESNFVFNDSAMAKCYNFNKMFFNTEYKSISLEGLSVTNLEQNADMSYMFADSDSLTNVSLLNAKITDYNNLGLTVDMNHMFADCKELTFTNNGASDTAYYSFNESDTNNKFKYDALYGFMSRSVSDTDGNLTSFSLEGVSASNLSYMFYGCSSLRGLPYGFFKNLYTYKCTDFSYMFGNAFTKSDVDAEHFTKEATAVSSGVFVNFYIQSDNNANLSHMFDGTQKLTFIYFDFTDKADFVCSESTVGSMLATKEDYSTYKLYFNDMSGLFITNSIATLSRDEEKCKNIYTYVDSCDSKHYITDINNSLTVYSTLGTVCA